jgi:hypothetical protein
MKSNAIGRVGLEDSESNQDLLILFLVKLMTTLRARCFTKLNDLTNRRKIKESNSKEEDYLPAG